MITNEINSNTLYDVVINQDGQIFNIDVIDSTTNTILNTADIVVNANGISSVFEDKTPKLGGNLDLNGFDIPVSTSIQNVFDSKIDKTAIKDLLTSTDSTSPLSAKQGKVLKDLIDNLDLSNIAETATLKHFTTTLLDKLNNIADNANNYTHPASHSPTIIEQDSTHRFVTDTEKATWNSNGSGDMFTSTILDEKTITLGASEDFLRYVRNVDSDRVLIITYKYYAFVYNKTTNTIGNVVSLNTPSIVRFVEISVGRYAVACQNGTDYLPTVMLLDIVGTTLTITSTATDTALGAVMSSMSFNLLSDGKMLLAYGNSATTYVSVVYITGSTIYITARQQISATSGYGYIKGVKQLDSSRILIAYGASTQTGFTVLSKSGNTITFNTLYEGYSLGTSLSLYPFITFASGRIGFMPYLGSVYGGALITVSGLILTITTALSANIKALSSNVSLNFSSYKLDSVNGNKAYIAGYNMPPVIFEDAGGVINVSCPTGISMSVGANDTSVIIENKIYHFAKYSTIFNIDFTNVYFDYKIQPYANESVLFFSTNNTSLGLEFGLEDGNKCVGIKNNKIFTVSTLASSFAQGAICIDLTKKIISKMPKALALSQYDGTYLYILTQDGTDYKNYKFKKVDIQ